jgi:DNA-binding FadR family transcriptional regulator
MREAIAAAQTDHERRLADLILAEAQRAGLRPGARLPTERQLAMDLGVTRTAVRHALATIEADGHITREVGRGTFLRHPDKSGGYPLATVAGQPGGYALATMVGQLGDVAPADVMAVRRLLEPPAMALVVAWATARDLAEVRRCLVGGDGAETYEEFEHWDLALHRQIIAASHSPLLMQIYTVVESARQGQMWGDLKRRSDSRQRRHRYQDDHRTLVEALGARDAGAAVAAMRTHLDHVAQNLLGNAHP